MGKGDLLNTVVTAMAWERPHFQTHILLVISRLKVEILNKKKSYQSSLRMLLDWPMQYLSDVITSNEVMLLRHNLMY